MSPCPGRAAIMKVRMRARFRPRSFAVLPNEHGTVGFFLLRERCRRWGPARSIRTGPGRTIFAARRRHRLAGTAPEVGAPQHRHHPPGQRYPARRVRRAPRARMDRPDLLAPFRRTGPGYLTGSKPGRGPPLSPLRRTRNPLQHVRASPCVQTRGRTRLNPCALRSAASEAALPAARSSVPSQRPGQFGPCSRRRLQA